MSFYRPWREKEERGFVFCNKMKITKKAVFLKSTEIRFSIGVLNKTINSLPFY